MIKVLTVDEVKKNIDKVRFRKTMLSAKDVVKDIEKVGKLHIGKTVEELAKESSADIIIEKMIKDE